ncbi:MAG TPA: DUF5655 domain-containing protein [Candidatus Thermoplasmatota archaeon]|nr:DUF5655 domain-containing protein [Candidatus Thermoplasmatota archaeon]
MDAATLLHRALLSLGPDVAHTDSGGFHRYWRGDQVFAVLRVMKTRVHVGFNKLGKARAKRILHAETARLPHVHHRVVVQHPADVDSELLAWLQESYENVDVWRQFPR